LLLFFVFVVDGGAIIKSNLVFLPVLVNQMAICNYALTFISTRTFAAFSFYQK
jgi:hypothetical protein